MWTRAPPCTSVPLHDCFIVPSLALDQEEEGEEACSPRLHHNHQPGEQELEYTKPLALDYPFSQSTTIHHDPPEASGSFKRLPTEHCRAGFVSDTCKLSHMSTPESTSVPRVRPQLLRPQARTSPSPNLVGCMSLRQLDDMQTQIASAHTRASSDQEVPELLVSIWSAPSKRRRLVHNEFKPKDSPDSLSPEACEDSGLTAEQYMADLDSSKASTPEDIDSAAAAAGHVSASLVAASDQLAAPRCSSTPRGKQVDQKKNNVESQVILEPRQLDHLHFSATHPSDDDTQSTSQIRIWVPHSRGNESPTRYPIKTMDSGSDEWLQLSLGSRQSEEPPVEDPAEPQSPPENPPTSTTADPPQAIRDFFKFSGHSESTSTRNTSSPYRAQPAASTHSGESSRHQHYSGTPESTRRSSTLPRPLTFLEPKARASRDSLRVDPNVHIPRVPSGGNIDQFLSPSPVLQKGYNPQPAFSNLSTLPYHPARVLQPVRSEQTETTSVHTWRTEAGASSSTPWMHPPGHHDPPRTPPNPAEFLSMATPGAFGEWRSGSSPSFLSMQPPLAQGVDPEQAWRNLLQRVGNNLNVPSGFGGASSAGQRAAGEAMMLPPVEREEYLDALTRAVERFQGADQGGKDEPLTELQRLQRSAMFPPGQRPHLGPTFDPSTDINLARYFNTSSSSGSKPRAPVPAPAPASSSDRQRRILRPHAPRPGLWFTLQASNSQPEASPLQQIPIAYIRVVDDSMTVAALRRYLVNKLGLASEDEVELMCKGQPLQPSIPLSQVRDGIWQSPNTNTPNPSTPQLLSEGKAWKAPDGSITLVGDVVMVLTYGRRPQPPPTST